MTHDEYRKGFEMLTGCLNAKDYADQKNRIWNPPASKAKVRHRVPAPTGGIPGFMGTRVPSSRTSGHGEL